jgi:hypothetical protein
MSRPVLGLEGLDDPVGRAPASSTMAAQTVRGIMTTTAMKAMWNRADPLMPRHPPSRVRQLQLTGQGCRGDESHMVTVWSRPGHGPDADGSMLWLSRKTLPGS